MVNLFTNLFGVYNFIFLYVSYFTYDIWIYLVFIDLTIMWFLFPFMFLLGLLFYRYGLLVVGAFMGFLLGIVLTGFAKGWLTDFLVTQFQTLNQMFYMHLLASGIIIYGLSRSEERRVGKEGRLSISRSQYT